MTWRFDRFAGVAAGTMGADLEAAFISFAGFAATVVRLELFIAFLDRFDFVNHTRVQGEVKH